MPRILPDSYFGEESRAELDAREADAQKQAAEAEKKKKKDGRVASFPWSASSR